MLNKDLKQLNNNLDKKIGWVGTGVMGQSMCAHLLNAGYKVSVYNRSKNKTDSCSPEATGMDSV